MVDDFSEFKRFIEEAEKALWPKQDVLLLELNRWMDYGVSTQDDTRFREVMKAYNRLTRLIESAPGSVRQLSAERFRRRL